MPDSISVVPGLVLLAVTAVVLFKKIIAAFKISDNGFVNVFILMLIAAAIFSASFELVGVFHIHSLRLILLTDKNLSDRYIEKIKNDILSAQIANVWYLIAGYGALIIKLIIIKVIEHRNKEIQKKTKHWDWENIK